MKWLFIALFFLTRINFANPDNIFFDSKEYLLRWSEPRLLTALTSGHPPLHSGYVLTFWPIFQVSKAFANPAAVVVFCQIIMSLLTVIVFFKTIKILFNENIALKSSIIFSLIPIVWITNGSIMMESTYLFYWITSLFFFIKFLVKKDIDINLLVLSGLFWIISFLTHSVVILWIPLFLVLSWQKSKERFKYAIFVGLLSIIAASFINAWLLALAHGSSIKDGFYWLYAAKFGEHADLTTPLESFLRYLRNWILPTLYNNTWLVTMMAVISFFLMVFKKEWKNTLIFFCWISPTFIANQWWDSLLYGRHSLIASFGIAILVVLLLKRNIQFLIFTAVLFVISLSSLLLLKQEIPYLLLAKAESKLPSNGLLIESHFARPQTDKVYQGEIIFVDEPGFDIKILDKKIEEYLNNQKNIYISGQALSEPYGLFSGPYLHPITLSYRRNFILSKVMENYGLSEFEKIDETANLVLYKVDSTSDKPAIAKLNNHRRRIDYFDPIRLILGRNL